MNETEQQVEQSPPDSSTTSSSLSPLQLMIINIVVVVLSVVCLVLCIFIMAKSSQYFSFLFNLSSQSLAKAYLNTHYKAFLTSLYVAIMGFVVVSSGTVLFFCKFSQKHKMVFFHGIYLLVLMVAGIVALTDYDYLDRMTILQGVQGTSNCTANGYLDECLLSIGFISYRADFMAFFISFIIFFILFGGVYHFAVLKGQDKLQSKNEGMQQSKESIGNANRKNVLLVV